jgi:hypothetical protein
VGGGGCRAEGERERGKKQRERWPTSGEEKERREEERRSEGEKKLAKKRKNQINSKLALPRAFSLWVLDVSTSDTSKNF